ncbi:MAG: hypothetical protein HC819_03440 [Cyclobacteriaceae bacterium]|nr:hypothetical protein [Cyclobacteriaceae bacterium]
MTGIFAAATFWPFISPALIHGMGSSLGLYFQKFEFNASIFYIVRAIGFWVKGWDIIQVASFWMALCSALMIVALSMLANVRKQNLPGIFLWPFFIYFAFASIIHPWYAVPLVAFSIFSRYRFPLIWSFTIFLSYIGYSGTGFQEHFWVLLLEYVPVYAIMGYELWKHRDLMKLSLVPTE